MHLNQARGSDPEKKEELKFNLLTAIVMKEQEGEMSSNITQSNKFLRDTTINLLAAGRDTISSGLTWFFWLVATRSGLMYLGA